jgi:hypothetical protein
MVFDYQAKTYDLYVNGSLVANGLVYRNDGTDKEGTSGFLGLGMEKWSTKAPYTTLWLTNVKISYE